MGTRTGSLLLGIVLLGGVARFWNLNWDSGPYTLHPDEWALNQVVRRLGPDLNPHFFYGSFPIISLQGHCRGATWLTGLDWLDTSRLALIGRFYAALCSTFMLPLVFLVGRRLWGVTSGLVAASLAPQRHSLSRPLILAPWIPWSRLRELPSCGCRCELLMVEARARSSRRQLCLASQSQPSSPQHLSWSCQHSPFSCRVLGFPVILDLLLRASRYLAFVSACVLVALVASPYYLLDWNELRSALAEQTQELNGGYTLVYTWQFIGTTPYLFEGSNLLIWSVGLATGISGVAGWALTVTRMLRRRVELLPALLLTLWPTLYFVYIGTWEARFVRHTLPLVPFLCLFAAGAIGALLKWGDSKDTLLRTLSRAVAALVVTFSALWGLAFLSIYASTDTRLAATDWFHSNVPAGTGVVVEDKDTLIPIPDAAHPVQTYKLAVIEPTTPDAPGSCLRWRTHWPEGTTL